MQCKIGKHSDNNWVKTEMLLLIISVKATLTVLLYDLDIVRCNF